MNLLSGHYVMRRQYIEIRLGSCWHKNECMGPRSTIKHNVQLFYKFEQPKCNHQFVLIKFPSQYENSLLECALNMKLK